ncbi:hypothetical protein LINGRAHAP2_LOCUS16147 [Linum grandiflorum]
MTRWFTVIGLSTAPSSLVDGAFIRNASGLHPQIRRPSSPNPSSPSSLQSPSNFPDNQSQIYGPKSNLLLGCSILPSPTAEAAALVTTVADTGTLRICLTEVDLG